MKRVLIYTDENHGSGPYVWDISTPELRDKSYRALFKMFKDDFDFYTELEGNEKVLFEMAQNGDIKSIERFMKLRKGYEYEDFDEIECQQ